jgi:hypothetical protein
MSARRIGNHGPLPLLWWLRKHWRSARNRTRRQNDGMGIVSVSKRQYGFVGIPTGQGISYRAESNATWCVTTRRDGGVRTYCDGGDPGVVPPGWNLMTMTGRLYRYVRPGNQPSLSDLFSRLVVRFVVMAVMLSSWCLVEVVGGNVGGNMLGRSPRRAPSVHVHWHLPQVLGLPYFQLHRKTFSSHQLQRNDPISCLMP